MSLPTENVPEDVQLLLALGVTLASEDIGSLNKYLRSMNLEDVIEEPEVRIECEKRKKQPTNKSKHASPSSSCSPGFATPEALLSLQMKQAAEFLYQQIQDENVSMSLKELESWKEKNAECEVRENNLTRLRDLLRMTEAYLNISLPKHTG